MHEVVAAHAHSTEVLKQPAERTVLLELESTREERVDGPGRTQQLGARDHDDPERRNDEDADPERPAPKRALLGDGYGQAHLVGKAPPQS